LVMFRVNSLSRRILKYAITPDAQSTKKDVCHLRGVAMMNNDEFVAWCENNKLSDRAIAFLRRIRSSGPVRKVESARRNVRGRFSSLKMSRTVQIESHSRRTLQHIQKRGTP